MTGFVPSPSAANTHLRAGIPALLLLALTSIHHAYGAAILDTPWRLHVLYFILPVAALVAMLLSAGWYAPTGRSARLFTWAGAIVVLAVPIILVGYVEGGYNHVVKNIAYLIVSGDTFRAIFPNPPYKEPNDLFFEITGIAQFPLSVLATVMTVRMLRR